MALRRLFISLVLLAAGIGLAPACGSDARSTDTCKTIETERCKRGPACAAAGVTGFSDYFLGDADSCIRFYEVQCGRGVPDEVKEPSKSELATCVLAIQNQSCAAISDPSKMPECAFLTANSGTPVDAAIETAAETSSETAAEAAAETAVDAASDADASD